MPKKTAILLLCVCILVCTGCTSAESLPTEEKFHDPSGYVVKGVMKYPDYTFSSFPSSSPSPFPFLSPPSPSSLLPSPFLSFSLLSPSFFGFSFFFFLCRSLREGSFCSSMRTPPYTVCILYFYGLFTAQCGFNIAFVCLHTRLVKRVHTSQITAHSAGFLKKVDHIAKGSGA